MKSLKLNLTAAAMAATVAIGGSFAAPQTAQAEVSYNIGIHSKYLLRGIFDENDNTAVQGGVDWSNDEGWYAGWWFSNLGYFYESNGVDGSGALNTNVGSDTNTQGFENDFYGGYSGKFGKGFGYDVGFIQYLYINVDDSDLLEATGTLTYSDFYVGFQYLLNDGFWGNSGDIYWKAGWATTVASDIGLALDLGYYTYNDSDNSDLGGKTAGNQVTTNDSGFRHLNVTATKPIGKTGAEAYVQYTFAGEDRAGTDYTDSMVVGITYGF